MIYGVNRECKYAIETISEKIGKIGKKVDFIIFFKRYGVKAFSA
jgi:hypothetical protein